jgi:hypothetical protein
MSIRDSLIHEIENQPDRVLIQALHFIRFTARQTDTEQWDDILPNREVEQEILDLLDAP